LRPSAALDLLVKLNLQLDGDARFTDGQLRTFFSIALDQQIQDALVLVTEQNLDAYAAQADLVFDRPTFTPSNAAFPVMGMQHRHAHNGHYNQSHQGRSNNTLATLKRSATSSSSSGSDSRRQRVHSPASVGFSSQTDLAERVAALEMQLNRDSADSFSDFPLNDQSASAR
jgi:hypothetical protein